jgi:UDPglucose 6-dehydrogenase
MMRQKITVVGIGYVGLGVGVMLSTRHNVTMLDVDQKKVDLINGRKSPIKDEMISRYLGTKESISISATTDSRIAYDGADFIIVAVPTNYDEETKKFDTRIVENVVNEAIGHNQNAVIVIKSTIPVGYTAGLIERLEGQGFKNPKVLFSPEFLREGTALKDNLFPSRVIVGYKKGDREQFSLAGQYLQLVRSASEGEYQELAMGSTEAEAVKLFANTYLAMRVAYFNELDTYAECNGLDAKEIIEGMCYDPRIGNQYNNPSFGYGGYCFPKDTKQLLSNFEGIPQNLIGAIVDSNETRKNYITSTIKEKIDNEFGSKATVGIYKLAMKSGSDNSRQSAILDIIKKLTKSVYQILIVVYDPANPKIKNGGVVISEDNLDKFKEECDIIITNRYDPELDDVKDKVYTRDVFNDN